MVRDLFNRRPSAPLSRGRRTGVLAAVVAVLASYSVVGAVDNAYAASLSGSAFEIDTDANLVPAGGQDWLLNGALRTAPIADKPSGGTDDSFTQGTHEDSAVPTIETGSIPPNKSDLKHFGFYQEVNDDGVFLNVYWTRVQDPSGTTNMDFEFNQSDVKNNDPQDGPQIIPVRTVGDLLLTYDLSNGGTKATISKRFWGGSSWGPATALGDTIALGTVNTSAISAANAGALGALDPRTFGEASVDLLALLPPAQGCRTYGSVYLKSRSSDSFNAALKDFIAPAAADISNCGSIRIHKTDGEGHNLGGAVFTLYPDSAHTAPGDAIDTCTSDATTGICAFDDVKKGTYWLVETTTPAGHDTAASREVAITTGNQVVELEIADPVQRGTITVTKNAVPNDAQDFTFNLDGDSFSLDDDDNGTLPNTRSFPVLVGAHSLSETNVPDGWVRTNLVCTDPTSNTTVDGATASINVAKNETVACTYTNTFTKLDVNLQTQASASGGGWTDTASLTGDGVHPVTGTVAFYACAAQNVATACTSGGTAVGSGSVSGSGSSYSASMPSPYTGAAAGWTCFRAQYTSTSDFYASSSHTNNTTECFLKQAADLSVTKTATAAYGRLYTWTVDKSVDDDAVSIAEGETATSSYTVSVANSHVDSAWTVTGTITVTNPNPVAFENVDVTDAIDNGADCVVDGGDNATVPANGHLDLGYTCNYGTGPEPAAGTNTATATWSAATYFTPHGSDTGTASVNFNDVVPSTTNEIVTVTDTLQGTLGTLDARTADNPTVYEYTIDRSGEAGTCTTYDNTATATANDTEAPATDSASVEVCVGSGLLVTGSAAGTFDRTFLWSIDKAVDRTTANPADETELSTFNYTVTASPDGMSDSGYELGGSLTVNNPNDWEDIVADVTVTTDLGGGSDCVVANGDDATIPAGGEATFTYVCTFTSAPELSGTVSASAAWDADAASTPDGSTELDMPVDLTIDATSNATVTVVDDKTDPTHPVTLGVANFVDGPTEFTYSLAKAVGSPETDCTTYTNVATIVETDQSDTQDVRVCFTGGAGEVVIPPVLPHTGDMSGLLARWAIGMLLGGTVLMALGRGRRTV